MAGQSETMTFSPSFGAAAKPTPVLTSANLRGGMDEMTPGEHSLPFLVKLICHPRFETFGGCVVLFNFMIMTMETHAVATKDENILLFVTHMNRFLLFYYTAELTLRLYVMKMKFFLAAWNMLDLTIVVTGWITELLEFLQVTAGMDQIAMFKSLRMLRLLRLVRLFVAFRELYVLVAGIGRCMKTLFWASGLIFIVLNVWAILSVEFLDGKVKELIPSGVYSTCGWCETAFSNIWYSNLTWFQIISTTGWITIGRPLAEEFWWPYAFFVFNVFIVMWGLLNLIVAAIVDASIAAREDDVAIAAKIAEQANLQALASFQQICRDMDEDGSGDVSVDEFKCFLKKNVELQQHLTIMGIQEQDVNDLMMLMDEDGNGTLECEEFVGNFTAMRTLVEKTSLYFLIKYCQNIQGKLVRQGQVIQSLREDMTAVISSFTGGQTDSMQSLLSDKVSAADVTAVKSSCNGGQTDSTSTSAASPKQSLTSDKVSAADMTAVKSSCNGSQTYSTCGFAHSTPAASPKQDLISEKTAVADPGALGTTAQKLVAVPGEKLGTTGRPEMPRVDMESLPPGWYYFGASLPPEASAQCKAKDPASKFSSTRLGNDRTKGLPVFPHGQEWEPLWPNNIPVHHAKHMNVKAPLGDIGFPQEFVDALAVINMFLDSLYTAPFEDDPVPEASTFRPSFQRFK